MTGAGEKLLAALSHTADYHLDYTYPGLSNEEVVDQLLSEHAHELAEAVRDRTSPLTPGDCTCEPYCCSCAEIAAFIETYSEAP